MEKPWLDYASERRKNQEMLNNNPRYVHDLGGVKFFDRIKPMGSADFGAADFGDASSTINFNSLFVKAGLIGLVLWHFHRPILNTLRGFGKKDGL